MRACHARALRRTASDSIILDAVAGIAVGLLSFQPQPRQLAAGSGLGGRSSKLICMAPLSLFPVFLQGFIVSDHASGVTNLCHSSVKFLVVQHAGQCPVTSRTRDV